MVRECACGCGTEFDNASDVRRKYAPGHQKKATEHAARNRRIQAHEITFVGVDGEGIPRWCNTPNCLCRDYEPSNPDNPDFPCVCGHPKAAQRMSKPGQSLNIRPGHEHCYVELGCGDDQIENYNGLGFGEIFDFLYNECRPKYPANTAFVGYALGYDWSQWLKTIPVQSELQVAKLCLDEYINTRPGRGDGKPPLPVHITDPETGVEWEIDMLPHRRIQFRPRAKWGEFREIEIGNGPPPPVRWREDYRFKHYAKAGHLKLRIRAKYSWMYVCDVFSFWQKAFLSAINPADYPTGTAPVSARDFEEIKRGKDRRSTARLDDEMRYYNRLENRALAGLMRSLNANLTEHLEVRIDKKHWFGPGQIAQALLRKWGVPTRLEVEGVTPPRILKALKASFLAGWFEIFSHLYVKGSTWEYDINSAYPHVMQSLPCPLHGVWKADYPTQMPVTKMPKLRSGAYRIMHAKVHGSDPYIGTMLHRDLHGGVSRPHNTSGWYWQHELEAAIRAGLIDSVEIYEWFTYYPQVDTDHKNCAALCSPIQELYMKRLLVSKDSPAGKTFKLGYNSPYGKTAQSIGEPTFTNWLWASLITSGCRTMILDAIATHPEGTKAVRMVATDGVYFRSPHPTLSISDTELGQWSEREKLDILLYKPGMHWDNRARDKVRAGEPLALRTRGVSARAVANEIDRIDNESVNWSPESGQWPSIEIHSSFAIITPVQALRWGRFAAVQITLSGLVEKPSTKSKWHLAGLITEGDESVQDADPAGKRQTCTLCRVPGDNRPDENELEWIGDDPLPPKPHIHNMDAVYRDPETGEWRARVYWAGHTEGGEPGECIPHNEKRRLGEVVPDTLTDNGSNIDIFREGIGLE